MALLVLLFVVLGAITTQADEARQTVFRDLAWGDPPSALSEAIQVSEENGLVSYLELHGIKKLGNLDVTYVGYVFFQDRLAAILIASPDKDALERTLTAKYGDPVEDPLDFEHDAKWQSGDTLAVLDKDVLSDDATATLLSMSIAAEQKAWLEKQAESNAAAW